MPAVRKWTIVLPPEESEFVDSLVSSGTYASESDVIRAGLRALQAHETDLELWLREEVLPVVKAMEVDPGRAVTGEEIDASLRSRHAEWKQNQPA